MKTLDSVIDDRLRKSRQEAETEAMLRRIMEVVSHGIHHGEIVIKYAGGKPKQITRIEAELL